MSPRKGQPITTARTATEARETYLKLCKKLPPPPLWQLAEAHREWTLAVEAEQAERVRYTAHKRGA